jgi:CBS domain-containing protein
MANVQQLLDQKGAQIFTIGPDETVFDAITQMADKNVGSLAVVDDENLVGIIDERIYARRVVLKGKSSPKTPVRDIMAANVICTQPERTVEECMAVMTEKAVRHLPVLEGNQLVGIISIGDLVKHVISDQKFIIEQLEHYIAGH